MIPVIRSLDTIGPSMLLCSLLPCSGETILGLRESLKWATDCLTEVDSSVAVSSGGELFLRFISLTSLEHQVRAIHSHRLLHIHVHLYFFAMKYKPSLNTLHSIPSNFVILLEIHHK